MRQQLSDAVAVLELRTCAPRLYDCYVDDVVVDVVDDVDDDDDEWW